MNSSTIALDRNGNPFLTVNATGCNRSSECPLVVGLSCGRSFSFYSSLKLRSYINQLLFLPGRPLAHLSCSPSHGRIGLFPLFGVLQCPHHPALTRNNNPKICSSSIYIQSFIESGEARNPATSLITPAPLRQISISCLPLVKDLRRSHRWRERLGWMFRECRQDES